MAKRTRRQRARDLLDRVIARDTARCAEYLDDIKAMHATFTHRDVGRCAGYGHTPQR